MSVGYSPDKILQGRLLSQADAHRHRVGADYEQIQQTNVLLRSKTTSVTALRALTATVAAALNPNYRLFGF